MPKTDEIRVQSLPEVLTELAGRPYVVAQKYDGTSATFLVNPDDGMFHACGRNWSILAGDNCYWAVAKQHDLEAKLRALGGRYALQGEVCGPGIQKNPLGLKQISLFLFNAYDLEEHRHSSDVELRRIGAELGVPVVDVIETGVSFAHDQASLLRLAEGKYPGTTNEREGIVIRPREETFSAVLNGRLSFKAISNAYLLNSGTRPSGMLLRGIDTNLILPLRALLLHTRWGASQASSEQHRLPIGRRVLRHLHHDLDLRPLRLDREPEPERAGFARAHAEVDAVGGFVSSPQWLIRTKNRRLTRNARPGADGVSSIGSPPRSRARSG